MNEDRLPYTHSKWQTPATLRRRKLLAHTGNCTTHISTHNSTSEGTSYHSDIESHTAPFKTDVESHLNSLPFYSTTSMFITATAHSPVLPHIKASTNATSVLLIPHHTTRSSQSATHRRLHYSLVLPNFIYLFSSSVFNLVIIYRVSQEERT
jgi:2-keto-3-deoxy-galactonokinase